VTTIKLSKHDRYVLELKDRIKNNYDSISINVPLRHSKRSLGEIDIIAQKGNRFDLYEVKCSFRILKAKKQLSRLKKYLKLENTRSYFYCGNSKSLVTV
jgi:Holliday junction resolvase-like predicted endonuclease